MRLAPAVPIQQPVDHRRRHRLAHLLLVSLLDLCHPEHAAGFSPVDERRQDLRLLLGAQVLEVSTAPAAQVEQGIHFLGPA